MRAELLRPGERVEGWDQGGADPDAELRALGADRYYQLSRGVDGTGVTILTDRPIREFAPGRLAGGGQLSATRTSGSTSRRSISTRFRSAT